MSTDNSLCTYESLILFQFPFVVNGLWAAPEDDPSDIKTLF